MVLSQGAMTLGAVVWGLSAEIAGTRFTLLGAAFLFCLTAAVPMLGFSSAAIEFMSWIAAKGKTHHGLLQ